MTRHFHLGANRRGSYLLGPVDLVVGDLFAREAAIERRDRRPTASSSGRGWSRRLPSHRRDRWGGTDRPWRACRGSVAVRRRPASTRRATPSGGSTRGRAPASAVRSSRFRAVARPGGPRSPWTSRPGRAGCGKGRADRRRGRIAVRRRGVRGPVAGRGTSDRSGSRRPATTGPSSGSRCSRRRRRPASWSVSSTCSPGCRRIPRPIPAADRGHHPDDPAGDDGPRRDGPRAAAVRRPPSAPRTCRLPGRRARLWPERRRRRGPGPGGRIDRSRRLARRAVADRRPSRRRVGPTRGGPADCTTAMTAASSPQAPAAPTAGRTFPRRRPVAGRPLRPPAAPSPASSS